MKRSIVVLSLLVALLAFSCASLDTARLGTVRSAAIGSVRIQNGIGMQGFSGAIAAASVLAQLREFDMKPILGTLTDNLYGKNSALFPFAILPQSAIMENAAFQSFAAAKPGMGVLMYIYAPGHYSASVSEAVACEMAQQFPNVDGFIDVSASFELRKQIEVGAFALARLYAILNVQMRDRQGKIVFAKSVFAQSDTTIKVFLDAFDARPLYGICVATLDKAMGQFGTWVRK